MEDVSIIALYNQRDEKAIEETSLKYGAYCYSIANNILSDAQDSEECVNDTWMKAWNTIPPSRPRSLKLFLARITRNLSIDRYRNSHRLKRGRTVSATLDEISTFVPSRDVDDEIERKELATLLNTFLHSLPPRDSNIFIRRYFFVEEVSVIAEKYGLSESNVFKILSRTRVKLKKYLEKEGYSI